MDETARDRHHADNRARPTCAQVIFSMHQLNAAVTDFLRAMGAERRAGLWVAPGLAGRPADGFDVVAQRNELQEAKDRFLECTVAAARERRGLPSLRRNAHRARGQRQVDTVQWGDDGDERLPEGRDSKGWAGAV